MPKAVISGGGVCIRGTGSARSCRQRDRPRVSAERYPTRYAGCAVRGQSLKRIWWREGGCAEWRLLGRAGRAVARRCKSGRPRAENVGGGSWWGGANRAVTGYDRLRIVGRVLRSPSVVG